MKAPLITLLLVCGLSMQQTLAISDEPLTVASAIVEIKKAFGTLHLKFRDGVTNEQIIFGLQHSIADQRKTDTGRKFPLTSEQLTKVVSYYKALCAAIADNPADVEILALNVAILEDMKVTEDESLHTIQTERAIQEKYKRATRFYFLLEPWKNHPTEVNLDSELANKDKDQCNEGFGFELAGKNLVFMKQYLASLLEPIK